MEIIPIANPRLKMSKKEFLDTIGRVYDSGLFIGGPEVGGLEKRMLELVYPNPCGDKEAVGVASGTDALRISLQLLGIKGGDEVITPINTVTYGVIPIINLGAKPVFVDIDEETLNINIEKIREGITKTTKAIIPVHLYGRPVDVQRLRGVLGDLGQKDTKIIEDCAQAIGSTVHGKPVGSLGDLAAFSFYPTKNISGYGDGGMIVTTKELGYKARVIANGGLDKGELVENGINSRLDSIQAAIINYQLNNLEKIIERRRQIAGMYANFLYGVGDIILPRDEIGHVYHLFVIRTNQRDKLRDYLVKRNIQTEIRYYPPLNQQPLLRRYGYKEEQFPVAERITKEILALPMFPELTDEQVAEVVGGIKDFYK